MAAEKRQPDSFIEKLLFDEFYRVSFFQAVQLLEAVSAGKKALGEALSPAHEAVRFSATPGLAFPASDISDLRRDEADGPARMQVAFLGLIGPSGVLPHWYTALAMERAANKDHAFASFLDLFHHRLISLLYLAWKKTFFVAHYRPEAGDRYSRYFLSLLGLGTPGLAPRIGYPLESLVFCGGILSRQVASSGTIEAVVEYCLGVRASVVQFLERTIDIEPEDRTRVGIANAGLGVDAVCGSRVQECRTGFRVDLAPVGYADFIRLLPSGDRLKPLFSLVRYMVGAEFEFEIRPHLRRDEIPPCRLGLVSATAPRLGWSTWLAPLEGTLENDPGVTFDEATIPAGTR
ncbi:MAG: type VI secretion system baseplate subunit TssG [Geobacteraceae bacterium]|nr:type VI secretion system baseplate subunit TssG [Geobacteraceae bacterium]